MAVNRLLEVSGDNRLIIQPEALAIEAYRNIWERDDQYKDIAIKELSYIWFMYSLNKHNPYKEYYNIVERDEAIRKDIIYPKYPNWKKDKIVDEGCEQFKKHNYSGAVNHLTSALKGATEMERFFNNLNIHEKNESTGNYMWKPTEINNALIKTGMVMKTLQEQIKLAEQEIDASDSKVRGGLVKGGFEDA